MDDRADLIDRDPDLVRPIRLSVDQGRPPDRARHLVRIAQLFCTFWHTGDTRFLDAAVEPAFVDDTPPKGRDQGRAGAAAALADRRRAVPDLTCELADLLVVADRIAFRLHFRGTFTGTAGGVTGDGRAVDFIAFDFLHVGSDRVVEDWHLEDDLTLMRQTGRVTIPAG